VVRFALLSLSVLALGGCASFPDDGPAARSVVKDAHATSDKHYDLVKLDYRVVAEVAAHPPEPLTTLAGSSSTARLGLIEDGDLLSVSIFQPNSETSIGVAGTPSDSDGKSPSGQSLPSLLVDDAGRVSIPFGGQVMVAGLTPSGAAAAIKQALKGRFISPQVLVGVQSSPANSVTVLGEVKTSGLVRLSPNNDTLINVIAMAGGTSRPTGDVTVAITRAGRTTTAPLTIVLDDPAQNIRLAPKDEDDSLSLAGALSKLGGLDSNNANPSAVMLFRFERPEVAQALGLSFDSSATRVPVVYLLDLRAPAGFFVAQKFEVQSDDIIYVPHADLAEARKFFEVVNEVSSVGYDIAVTNTLVK